jgi:hypothetical protein
MSLEPTYRDFWRRKKLLAGNVPRFPISRWWESDELSDIERIYFDAIKESHSLLDFGAGDLRVFHKLKKAGYAGDYHTLDIGTEYSYTYGDLSEIKTRYEAILCLDVIEHMPLREGLALIDKLTELLLPGGTLILQTPNAQCIRNPWAWDMTHLHCYNITDLWAYLKTFAFDVKGYRIITKPPLRMPTDFLRHLFSAYFITRVLRCDYADNIALIAKKPLS